MSEGVSIRVNFSKPIPLFPLDSVVLLPQQVLPLHIFEPRYIQMVERSLDSAGQIAMATFSGNRWKQEYHGHPPLRPAVCVGQIVQHEKLPDGRYNVLLQGVCRARIIREERPDEDRLFRQAYLDPIGLSEDEADNGEDMRDYLESHLSAGPLTQFAAAPKLLELVQNEEVPTAALLELVSFALLTDNDIRYRLLAEGNAENRARLIREHLDDLESLIRTAMAQRPDEWPKGCSWN